MHVPPLFHAVDLQAHANDGSLWSASKPLHPVQKVAFKHPVQSILQANSLLKIILFYKNSRLLITFQIILTIPMHIPPLFHAVDLQLHVYTGSL